MMVSNSSSLWRSRAWSQSSRILSSSRRFGTLPPKRFYPRIGVMCDTAHTVFRGEPGAPRLAALVRRHAARSTTAPEQASNLLRKKQENSMIRKLSSGQYRLYSRKKDPKTGKRRNLGTFGTRKAAEAHERDVQYFKRQG